MRYLDFDLEVGPGVGREYPVSVRSTAGQTHGTMRFPFDTLELENALLKLEKALLQSGGTRRKAPTEQEEDVQHFGQALFEALLEGDLQSGVGGLPRARSHPDQHQGEFDLPCL